MKTWLWVAGGVAALGAAYWWTRNVSPAPKQLQSAQVSSVVYNTATSAWDIYVTKVYSDGSSDLHILATSIPGTPDSAPGSTTQVQPAVSQVLALPSSMVTVMGAVVGCYVGQMVGAGARQQPSSRQQARSQAPQAPPKPQNRQPPKQQPRQQPRPDPRQQPQAAPKQQNRQGMNGSGAPGEIALPMYAPWRVPDDRMAF
jgi:hypothetical protein